MLVYRIADGRERGMYDAPAFAVLCGTANSTTPRPESTRGVRVTATLRACISMPRSARRCAGVRDTVRSTVLVLIPSVVLVLVGYALPKAVVCQRDLAHATGDLWLIPITIRVVPCFPSRVVT